MSINISLSVFKNVKTLKEITRYENIMTPNRKMYFKQYRQKHKKRLNVADQEYYWAHRERIRVRQRMYYMKQKQTAKQVVFPY
jgi:hypothetical protein